jgi:hypothetical protein
MSRPQRIQLRRTKGWRKPANAVVVARPAKWGNPFRVEPGRPAGVCVEKFAQWLRLEPAGIALAAEARHELRGRNLACWCALGEPCHGDVLLAMANS